MKGIKVSKLYYSNKAFVSADENMITVAFRNIISNAIKYNYKNGEIKIQVVEKGNKHEILIEDNGIGMSNETIKKLFKFDEKHSKGTQGESSAGIGLILTKEFLDKHDANITVNSRPNKGTSFKIEI